MSFSASGVISLSVWSCHVLEHQMLLLYKSQLFNLTNQDLGVGCWGESLLAQRGISSTLLSFLLLHCPKEKETVLLCLLKQNSSNSMSLPSPFCVSHLSSHFPLLCMFCFGFFFFMATGCLFCFLIFILSCLQYSRRQLLG